MVTGNGCYGNLFIFMILGTKGFVIVGSPDDVCVFLTVFRTAMFYEGPAL